MTALRARLDAEAIRQANPITRFLQRRGIELRGGGSAGWRTACPIHGGDNREAFHILPGDQRWHCFTGDCGSGDVIALVMKLDAVGFQEACARLGGQEHTTTTSTPRSAPKPKPPPAPLPELDDAKRKEMAGMAESLTSNPNLIEQLAGSREWEPATISALAWEGSLGWGSYSADHGAVAFIFPHAVKLRDVWWRDGRWQWHRDGRKVVSWHWRDWPWNGRELWRENRIRRLLCDRVILTEGEPDAITVIDAGGNDHHSTVCAIPSASIGANLKARLPDLVRGLHVRMAADADPAGRAAAKAVHDCAGGRALSFSELTLP